MILHWSIFLKGKNLFKEILQMFTEIKYFLFIWEISHWEYVFKIMLQSAGVTKYISWMIHSLTELSLGTLPVVLQFSLFSSSGTFLVLSFLIRSLAIHWEYHFGRKLTSHCLRIWNNIKKVWFKGCFRWRNTKHNKINSFVNSIYKVFQHLFNNSF